MNAQEARELVESNSEYDTNYEEVLHHIRITSSIKKEMDMRYSRPLDGATIRILESDGYIVKPSEDWEGNISYLIKWGEKPGDWD